MEWGSAGSHSGRKRLIERSLLLAGVILFVGLVWHVGAEAVWTQVVSIGWGLPLIIAQEAVAVLGNTLGWWFAVPGPRSQCSFGSFLAARVAGDAINGVTPTLTLGGELVRARWLEPYIGAPRAWASVVVAKTNQALAQAIFVTTGVLFVLPSGLLPVVLRNGLIVAVALFAGAALAIVTVQRMGMLLATLRWAERVGLRLSSQATDFVTQIDEQIRQMYSAPAVFWASIGAFLVAWFDGVVEVYVVLWFLDLNPSWERALTIEVFSALIEGMLFFVPAKAGTQEGGKVAIFTLLGMQASSGLALGIARRLRDLAWAGLGLLVYARWLAGRG